MKLRATNLLFILTLLCIAFACDTGGEYTGESEKYFIKYYGEDGEQEAVDFHINDDGTVLILASTVTPSGFKQILLIKVDDKGNILWQKKYGTPNVNEGPQDIEPTVNGGQFLILSNMFLGTDPSTNEGKYDFKVIRIEEDGTKIDSMVFNNNGGDWETQFMRSITPISNGGFVTTGNSTDETIFDPDKVPPSVDLEELIILTFNSDYSQYLSQNPVSPGEQFGSGIKIFEDGNDADRFFWFCYLDQKPASHEAENSNFATFSFGLSGQLEVPPPGSESAVFSGVDGTDEILVSVCKVPNSLGGGFYELGTSRSSSTATSGTLYFSRRGPNLTKTSEGFVLNKEGNPLGGNLSAVDVAPAKVVEGFLVLANEQTSTGSTIRLTRLTSSSREEWSTNFGSFGRFNSGAKVAELPDGRIFVLGTIALETQKKVALIKVNRNGEFLN
ncbi:MAG TPA: hypothetical protein VGK59_15535 [Ohtaekwangia sp.]